MGPHTPLTGAFRDDPRIYMYMNGPRAFVPGESEASTLDGYVVFSYLTLADAEKMVVDILREIAKYSDVA